MNVAQTILGQLGGRKFTVMTGAKNFIGGENYLSFRLPGGGGFCKNSINYVLITLDASDTYTVTFSRVRGQKLTTVATETGIYADVLQQVFTLHTGLVTSLGTMSHIPSLAERQRMRRADRSARLFNNRHED